MLKLRAICQKVRYIRRAFSSFRISAVWRDANNVAHLYAKQASRIGGYASRQL
jgi:hypothetical protein